MIKITILGQPIPLQRHRYVFKKGKMISYDPQNKKKESFAWKCRAELNTNFKIIEGAFKLTANFYVSKESLKDSEEGADRLERPDYDNYLKFVLDALQGSFWTEDSHMTRIEGGKFHSKTARTELMVEQL